MTDISASDAAVNVDLDAVTLITSTNPASVGKIYDFQDGALSKRGIANIVSGTATAYEAKSGEQFAGLLDFVTQQTNAVVCPALWIGDTGPDFDIVTEAELSRLLGHPIGSLELAGVHDAQQGRRVAARLRRGLVPTTWVLFDMDDPPGIPDDWRALDLSARLVFWDRMLPGLSACERVVLRGSSARVTRDDRPPGGPTHAWIRVDDPSKIAVLKAYLSVRMVIDGMSFPSPRHSRVSGEVIGEVRRSVFDLSVLDAGRLVFCSRPELTQAAIDAGYTVDIADVRVENTGGGVLAISGIEMPDADALRRYHSNTGELVSFAGVSGTLSVTSRGLLVPETEIESRGQVQTLAGWLADMAVGDVVRCEAPFRASVSEAAFIRCTAPGVGFVHDVGCGTTYVMDAATIARTQTDAVADVGERLAAALGPAVVEQAARADAVRNPPVDATRELVMAGDGEFRNVVDRMMATLPVLSVPVFNRGGALYSVSENVMLATWTAEGWRDVPTLGVQETKLEWLAFEMAKRLNFARYRGRVLVSMDPPVRPLRAVLQHATWPVPTLRGIISTPTMRADGSLLIEQGYDVATGFWLNHTLDVTVPETPTQSDALASLAALAALLDEFPFNTERDRAVALAAMMSAVLRPAFPTMPGTLITASSAGSGKSYLTSLIGLLATGRDPSLATWPPGDEFEKQLNAMLLTGAFYLAFDNANGVSVGGDKVCAMLTSHTIRLRPLGRSEEFEVPTTGMMLVVNGNAATVKEDASQRFLTCYITPDVENPRTRDFQFNPVSEIMNARGAFVSDILTIARAYHVAGRPDRLAYGSFDAWAGLVPSALVWLGLPNVLASIEDATAEDPELMAVRGVLRLVLTHFGTGREFLVSGLAAAVNVSAAGLLELAGLVGANAGPGGLPTPETVKRRLGVFLRDKCRDRVVALDGTGRVRLRRARVDRDGAAIWWLESM